MIFMLPLFDSGCCVHLKIHVSRYSDTIISYISHHIAFHINYWTHHNLIYTGKWSDISGKKEEETQKEVQKVQEAR